MRFGAHVYCGEGAHQSITSGRKRPEPLRTCRCPPCGRPTWAWMDSGALSSVRMWDIDHAQLIMGAVRGTRSTQI
eukprot:2492630-Prymnesium_polylepis.2